MKLTNILCNSSNLHNDVAKRTSVCLDEYAHKQIPLVSFSSSETTGGSDVEYDYNNISAVCKTMYENASKITVNAMCRK